MNLYSALILAGAIGSAFANPNFSPSYTPNDLNTHVMRQSDSSHVQASNPNLRLTSGGVTSLTIIDPCFTIKSRPFFPGFSKGLSFPSAALGWNVVPQHSGGTISTSLVSSGLHVVTTGVRAAITQRITGLTPTPNSSAVVTFSDRIQVASGIVGISVTSGTPSYTLTAYPHAPLKSTSTNKWITLASQTVVPVSGVPAALHLTLVSLTPSTDFTLSCSKCSVVYQQLN